MPENLRGILIYELICCIRARTVLVKRAPWLAMSIRKCAKSVLSSPSRTLRENMASVFQQCKELIMTSGMPMGSDKKSGTTFCGKPVCVGDVQCPKEAMTETQKGLRERNMSL